jgi:hypothetical protein
MPKFTNQVYSLLFIFLCIGYSVTAQENDTISKHHSFGRFKNELELISKNPEGNYLVLRKHKKNYFLELIDANANLVSSKPILTTYRGFNKKPAKAFQMGNKLYVASDAYNPKKEMYYTIVDEYDLNSLSYQREVSIDSVKSCGMRLIWGFQVFRSTVFTKLEALSAISPGGSKATFVISTMDCLSHDNEDLKIRVFSSDMKETKSFNSFIPLRDGDFQLMQTKISNNGTVYLLGKERIPGMTDVKEPKQLYKWHVFAYSGDNLAMRDIVIAPQGKLSENAIIEIDSKGNLAIGGFYQKRGEKCEAGSYFMLYDGKTLEKISESSLAFDKEFMYISHDPKYLAGNYKFEWEMCNFSKLHRYEPDYLVELSTGEWIMTLEQYWGEVVGGKTTDISTNNKYSRVGNGSDTRATGYLHHFDDIGVVRINQKGIIERNDKVLKNQKTSSKQQKMSYAFTCDDTGIHLFYLYQNTGPFEQYTISPDGKAKEETYHLKGRGRYPFYTNNTSTMGQKELLILRCSGAKAKYSILKGQ